MLFLKLLGTPVIQLAEQPVGHFRSAKSLALLAYLVIEQPAVHSRASLIALLWPELPEDKARQNLSQTLTRLRDALGAVADELLVANRQAVWVAETAVFDLDYATFHQLLAEVKQHPHEQTATCPTCQAKLAQAVALVRGSLLDGLEVDESYPFEEWLLLARERLHEQLLEALAELAEGALARQAYEAAVGFARRQIALESWREAAHRQLIQALALSGQRNAALAQYETCRRLLAEELGVEPTQRTQQLATAVREGTLTANAPRPATPLLSNIPHALTPFIGREGDLADLLACFVQEEARLVTLTGPGGMGKTRLAQELGRQILANPPQDWRLEGVWFVSLVGLSTAEDVPVAVANATGLVLPRQQSAAAAVIEQLRPRHLLLILDNIETVLESRTWLTQLLQAAGGVRLLVTSRERLRLLGEHHFPLLGLRVPPEEVGHGQALDYEASKLFLDRARRLYRTFRLTAESWPPIVRICRLTGGLPLGLELAATLLDEGEVGQIAARIEQDAAVLAADYPDIAPHQRSIQLVFQHSWERLTTAEQITLSRLTIFASEYFGHEAALQVTLAEWRQLAALARKSLIRPDGERRYTMHPLYKGLAAQRLAAEGYDVRRAHATYFAEMLAAAVPPTFDKQKHLQMRTHLPLLPDLRAAWGWCVATAEESLLALFAPPLYRFLRETAQLQEGRTLFEQAWHALQTSWPILQRTAPQRLLLAHLAAQFGFFRLFCGDAGGARPLLEQALAELNALHSYDEVRGDALAALSDLLRHVGEYEARLALWQEELPLAELSGDSLRLNRALGNVGEALYQLGQLAAAREVFARTIKTATADTPDYDLAITINNLGLAELALGNLPRARELLEQSLHIRQQYANTYRIASALRSLGLLTVAEGNLPLAEAQLGEALAQYTASGRVDGLGPTHLGLAQVAMARGDWPAAAEQIRTALGYAVQLDLTAQGLDGLWRWGEYLWRVGRTAEAEELWAYVLGHQNTSGFLAREIQAFAAVQGVVVQANDAAERLSWLSWLPHDLFLSGQK